MKIGELAEKADCQAVTIRYYEKEGLLKKPSRSQGGYRLYTQNDVDRLRFIRHCRFHAMALDEIKILLALRETPNRDCAEINELIDRHINEVAEKIKSLKKLKTQLERLREKCPNGGVVSSCGIIQGLTDREVCGCLHDQGLADEDQSRGPKI